MRGDVTGTASNSATCPAEPAITRESRVFLLGDDGRVWPIDHDRYVALGRGEASVHEFASRRFVLVDWYLRLVDGRPDAVVHETCSWVVFDSRGSLDPHTARSIAAEASPDEAQWVQIRALVFDEPALSRKSQVGS